MDNALHSPGIQSIVDRLKSRTQASVAAVPPAPHSPGVQAILDRLDTPDNVKSARGVIGSQDYNRYCERFVEAMTDKKTGQYPSAIEAWTKQQGTPGLDGIKKGDLLYFSADPSNDYQGHVGIYSGLDAQGQPAFVSATYDGVAEKSLPDWMQTTGQQPLGYVRRGKTGGN